MRTLFSILLALILFVGTMGAQSKSIGTPSGFAGKVYDATFALYLTKDDKSQFRCSATAFQKVSGGYEILSAGHCISGVPADVSFAVSDQLGNALQPVKIVRAVMDAGTSMDFAIFELKTAKNYPVIPLGDERDLRVGDVTMNANFTAGLAKQFTEGIVASRDMVNYPNYFMVEEYGNSGSSGSAVVSARTHKIVGVTIATTDESGIGLFIERISTFSAFMALPDMQTTLHQAVKDDDPEEN